MKKWLSCVLVFAGLTGLAAVARAHAISTSYLAVEPGAATVDLRWDLSLHDLVWSVFIDSDYDGVASSQEIRDARPAIEAAVLRQIAVSRGDRDCSVTAGEFSVVNARSRTIYPCRCEPAVPRPGS